MWHIAVCHLLSHSQSKTVPFIWPTLYNHWYECVACSICDESKPVEGLRSMLLHTNEVDTYQARCSLQVIRLQGENFSCQLHSILLIHFYDSLT